DEEGLVGVEVRAEDAVEADPVVDVEVRQEDRPQVGEAVGRQPAVLAGVEKEGVVPAGVIDEQDRVAGRAVDQGDLGEGAGRGQGRVLVRWGPGGPTVTVYPVRRAVKLPGFNFLAAAPLATLDHTISFFLSRGSRSGRSSRTPGLRGGTVILEK